MNVKYYLQFLLNEFHLGLYYLPISVNVIVCETKLVVTIVVELMGDQSNMTDFVGCWGGVGEFFDSNSQRDHLSVVELAGEANESVYSSCGSCWDG